MQRMLLATQHARYLPPAPPTTVAAEMLSPVNAQPSATLFAWPMATLHRLVSSGLLAFLNCNEWTSELPLEVNTPAVCVVCEATSAVSVTQ